MNIEKYTYSNREEINHVYIHDSYFNNVNIDLNNKKIYINLVGEYIEGRTCIMIFENVIHFECDRLDLWGGEENRILGIYLEDNTDSERYINDKIEKEQKKGNSKISFKEDKHKFINIWQEN